jgi:hypothetical protein
LFAETNAISIPEKKAENMREVIITTKKYVSTLWGFIFHVGIDALAHVSSEEEHAKGDYKEKHEKPQTLASGSPEINNLDNGQHGH